MTLPSQEATKLEQSARVILFTIDLTPIGTNIQYRFTPETQTNGLSVYFGGLEFIPLPIEATGFEKSNRSGSSATPQLRVSNIGGLISALLDQNADLVGARLTRQKTYAKYLDGGTEANPLMEAIPEVFIISRKSSEDDVQITIELQDIASFGNLKLPRRRLSKNSCQWKYRSSECGYTGTKYFDKNDKPTGDPNVDICGKRLSSCKARFGANAALPFGAFPGVDD